MKRKKLLRICAVLSMILCFELVFVLVVRGQGIGGAYRKNLNLGHQYILDEDYENAVKAFSEAIKANQNLKLILGLVMRIWVLENMKKHGKALKMHRS